MPAEKPPPHGARSPEDRYLKAPCGLGTIARRGELLDANHALLETLGIAELPSDRTFLDMLRPGDRIFWESHVAPLLDMNGSVQEIAIELTTPAGAMPALLNARNTAPGDPASTIDVALFPARDRRAYERELLNARRRAEASENEARLLAETLQATLLPPALPAIDGVDIGAVYRPAATDIGGDFYDFFRVDETDWVVAIGDVCGKGPHAATVTALVRYTIRGAAMETPEITEIMQGVNTALLLDQARETCTAIVARLAPHGSRLDITFSSAGHPLPLVLTERGAVRTGDHSTLLGAFRNPSYGKQTLGLQAGEALVLFTDGVVEARNGTDFYGVERLGTAVAALHGRPAQVTAEVIADAVESFRSEPATDDLAIVVVRWTGEHQAA